MFRSAAIQQRWIGLASCLVAGSQRPGSKYIYTSTVPSDPTCRSRAFLVTFPFLSIFLGSPLAGICYTASQFAFSHQHHDRQFDIIKEPFFLIMILLKLMSLMIIQWSFTLIPPIFILVKEILSLNLINDIYLLNLKKNRIELVIIQLYMSLYMIWLGLSYILIVRNLTWFELRYDFWEEKNLPSQRGKW